MEKAGAGREHWHWQPYPGGSVGVEGKDVSKSNRAVGKEERSLSNITPSIRSSTEKYNKERYQTPSLYSTMSLLG